MDEANFKGGLYVFLYSSQKRTTMFGLTAYHAHSRLYFKSKLGRKERYKHKLNIFAPLEFDFFQVQLKFAFRMRPSNYGNDLKEFSSDLSFRTQTSFIFVISFSCP